MSRSTRTPASHRRVARTPSAESTNSVADMLLSGWLPRRPDHRVPPGVCLECRVCVQSLACIRQKCKNPCLGLCGENALCQVVNHNPRCNCLLGYEGDPYRRCATAKSEYSVSVYSYLPIISDSLAGFALLISSPSFRLIYSMFT